MNTYRRPACVGRRYDLWQRASASKSARLVGIEVLGNLVESLNTHIWPRCTLEVQCRRILLRVCLPCRAAADVTRYLQQSRLAVESAQVFVPVRGYSGSMGSVCWRSHGVSGLDSQSDPACVRPESGNGFGPNTWVSRKQGQLVVKKLGLPVKPADTDHNPSAPAGTVMQEFPSAIPPG